MIPAGSGATLEGPSSNSFPPHPAVRVPGTNLPPFSSASSDTSEVVPARAPSLAPTPPRRAVSLAASQTNPSEHQVINMQQFLASSSSLPSMAGAPKSRSSFFHRNKSSKEDGETRSSTDSRRTINFPKFGPRGTAPPIADLDEPAPVRNAKMPEDGANETMALESLQQLDVSECGLMYWSELAERGILSKIMDYVSLACRYAFFF